MKKVKISRKKYDEFNGDCWNLFNEFLAMSELEDVSGLLKKTYMIYWFASEVANGGYWQYFDYKEDFNHDEVVLALDEFGLKDNSILLKEAILVNNDMSKSEDNDEDNLSKSDLLFEKMDTIEDKHNELPDLFECLQKILSDKENELVDWVD